MNSSVYIILTIVSCLSFLIYAISCLTTSHMVREFERYGLAKYRILVGSLQLLAVIGLLIGYKYHLIGMAAAAGLTLQMLLAIGVRFRIKDGIARSLPAAFYLLLNAGLTYYYVRS